MDFPPRRRHLQQEAVVPQEVHDLAVGVRASVGPERSPRGFVAARRLDQPDHRQLEQVLLRVDGAPGKVAGDLLRQVHVLQRQGIGSSMGVNWSLPPWPEARRSLTQSPWRVTHWNIEVDLQLLRSGVARRPAVAPLPKHPLNPGGIAHQHHSYRQDQLHHNCCRISSPCVRQRGGSGTFPQRGHHRHDHRLTSSAVTTGWMPWAFQ